MKTLAVFAAVLALTWARTVVDPLPNPEAPLPRPPVHSQVISFPDIEHPIVRFHINVKGDFERVPARVARSVVSEWLTALREWPKLRPSPHNPEVEAPEPGMPLPEIETPIEHLPEIKPELPGPMPEGPGHLPELEPPQIHPENPLPEIKLPEVPRPVNPLPELPPGHLPELDPPHPKPENPLPEIELPEVEVPEGGHRPMPRPGFPLPKIVIPGFSLPQFPKGQLPEIPPKVIPLPPHGGPQPEEGHHKPGRWPRPPHRVPRPEGQEPVEGEKPLPPHGGPRPEFPIAPKPEHLVWYFPSREQQFVKVRIQVNDYDVFRRSNLPEQLPEGFPELFAELIEANPILPPIEPMPMPEQYPNIPAVEVFIDIGAPDHHE